MGYLRSATAVLAVLVLLDLLLTLGLVRRLREHTRLLADRPDGSRRAAMPAVGTVLDDFTATTTDGERVSPGLLTGDTVVGFLAPGCGPCREQAPSFVRYARGVDGGRRQVLAVVLGEPPEVSELVDQLSQVARVVVEAPDGALCRAFQVDTFPAFGVIDSTATVIADRLPLTDLPGPVLV